MKIYFRYDKTEPLAKEEEDFNNEIEKSKFTILIST